MPRIAPEVRKKIRDLRKSGLTYSEINSALELTIPKGSMSYICKDIELTNDQKQRILELNRKQLIILRKKAVIRNKEIFDKKVANYRENNVHLKILMENRETRTIALAMLYLGEGAKWKGRRGPMLGSTDPQIITIYINLLISCYGISREVMRCRIQHRADQNAEELKQYWAEVTGIKKSSFYPSYVDRRTIGKVTKKLDYKGVCSVICPGTYIQLELEQIAGIINEALRGYSSVG